MTEWNKSYRIKLNSSGDAVSERTPFSIGRKQKKGKIDKPKASMKGIWVVLVVLVIITVFSLVKFTRVEIDWDDALPQTLNNAKKIFFEAKLKSVSLGELLIEAISTFAISYLTTIFSAVISIVLGLLAAKNFSSKKLSSIIKGFIGLIRAIPTVMWVLIFAVVAGLGPTAAVIGISFHSLGYLTKMFSETFEEIDQGVIEALEATGANKIQIVLQAILPTTIRSLAAWTFMRFEINYIVALGMGAAAGAGGIGFNLFMAGNFYYNMQEVGAITFVILISCFILEAISTRIKRKLEVQR